MFRIPPWEFEKQITSEWVTKLMAFKDEYTLDPTGARAAAIIAQVTGLAHGCREPLESYIDRREWVTREEMADRHLKAALMAWPMDKP